MPGKELKKVGQRRAGASVKPSRVFLCGRTSRARYNPFMARTASASLARRKLPYPARWLCEQVARTRLDAPVASGLSHHGPGRSGAA